MNVKLSEVKTERKIKMISAVSSFLIDMLQFELRNAGGDCRDGKQFFSIIEKFSLENRGQDARVAETNRGIPSNDSTIRLNKQRKVFNYSTEIFIKNFSHYFTLFFGSKFSAFPGKLTVENFAGRAKRRRHGKAALFYSN
jgi:hypothetical protein